MTVPAIHQLLPSFVPGDAIGTHVRLLSRLLREAGVESKTYVTTCHPSLRAECAPYRKASLGAEDVLLYHLSCADGLVGWLLGQPQRLLVDYHNITEPKWFDRWAPLAAHDMRLARVQLGALAPRAEAAFAHSRFSADELEANGYHPVGVAPLLFALPPRAERPQRPVPERGARWLFVGRLAPNKCQQAIIGALAAARRGTDPQASLTLVGGSAFGAYVSALHHLAADLGVADAVTFAGHVPDAELEAAYREADVFVCLSRHEGFGAPVVEAMARGVPVVALRAAAVGETAGDAALVLDDDDPAVVAAAVAHLATHPDLVVRLRAAGSARAAGFAPGRAGPTLVDHLLHLVGGKGSAGSADRLPPCTRNDSGPTSRASS